jgi:replication factor C subunit 1
LVAQESNRDVIELNASDARSKKALTEALGDLSGTHALSFGNADGSKKSSGVRKRCIVMDEVDGMGAGDRSGMSELIQMIKKAKVPIICICNDRSSQKMRSLVQYCMDLRYRRPTKNVIARRAVEVGKLEGMSVEPNAAEALSESCGNDIRQVLNCLQMWSSKKNDDNTTSSLTFKALSERKNAVNKDEVLRVSMFDACKLIIEGSRNISNGDPKAATASLIKRSDAYFVDYMLMGLNVHQNYLKVALGQFNNAKLKGDETTELAALDELHEATMAMSDFGVCENQLRGADQNWSLLPLCAMLAVKVRNHCIVGVLMPASPTFVVLSNSGGPSCRWSKRRLFGKKVLLKFCTPIIMFVLTFICLYLYSQPGYPEFAGWLGKNSSRNKKIRLLQELRHHMNYKVSADASELRMNYLPVMRQQFQELLFDKEGARVSEAIELMDQYGLDRYVWWQCISFLCFFV